jgi:Tol biopolymer transport system component
MTLPHDRLIADWLADDPTPGSSEGLARALAATRRTAKRPRWTFPERWLPMQSTMARTPSSRPLLVFLVVALLVLALGATAVLVGAFRHPLPEPFGLAGNGAVVFARDGDLYVADAPGATARLLLGGPTDDRGPIFSRQGDAIAFQRVDPAGAIHVMRADPGGNAVRELAGPFQSVDGLSWSPDGTRLLVGYADEQRRVSVVAADGSSRNDVAIDGAADAASWRPDGSMIVFRGSTTDEHGPDVFLAAADGTGVRALDLVEAADVDDFYGLTWSPDGTQLAYSLVGDQGWKIETVAVDPTGAVTGKQDPRYVPRTNGEVLPLWSPDGRSMAVIAERDGQRQVAIVPVDGSGTARLVGPAIGAGLGGFGYDWSPDGQTLLIALFPRSGGESLWSIDVDSGSATELHGLPADIPTWQRVAP